MGALLEKRSKVLLMSLTIFVTLQMMVGVVSGSFIFKDTHVIITNKLSEVLTLHCQDMKNDLGYHTLQPNSDPYSFKFTANPIFKISLYYCKFVWTGESHNFDIYVQKRDGKCGNSNRECSWIITQQGPCRLTNDPNNPLCYPWN
ncbi:putative plant self-incompatibility S1 [Lupinus albus]|uniref:S-protein homolog n=1 Tax=Lupinus albus TaxID=3870 RepID=A0A6A4QH18_LUPAL|nr:putative plant self-incompatibility S1 [Lupinus albus]